MPAKNLSPSCLLIGRVGTTGQKRSATILQSKMGKGWLPNGVANSKHINLTDRQSEKLPKTANSN